MKKNLVVIMSISLLMVMFSTSIVFGEQKQMKEVKLATLSWSPYYGAELEKGGYLAEITRQAFAEVGYQVQIDFMSWERAINLAKAGNYDGVLGAYYSQEREDNFAYSDSIGASELVLLAKKDSDVDFDSYNNLEQLKGYTIGTMKDYTYGEEFDKADFLDKNPAKEEIRNVKKLIYDRIDLILQDEKVILNIINKNFPEDKEKIKILKPAIKKSLLYNMFSRKIDNYEKLQLDFNEGLKKIEESGKLDEIIDEYGF